MPGTTIDGTNVEARELASRSEALVGRYLARLPEGVEPDVGRATAARLAARLTALAEGGDAGPRSEDG